MKWQLNDEGYAWAQDEKKTICSSKNPWREADQWVSSMQLTGQEKQVCIVGVGAIYHIIALRRRYPKVELILISSVDVDLFNAPRALQIEWQATLADKTWFFTGVSASDLGFLDVLNEFQAPIGIFRSAATPEDMLIFNSLRTKTKNDFLSQVSRFGFSKDIFAKMLEHLDEKDWVNIKSLSIDEVLVSKEQKLSATLQELIN